MIDKLMGAALGATLLLAVLAPAAAADTITFDSGSLDHGDKVTTQISGVTISAKNTDNDLEIAAIFDTTRTGTADPDLEDPFSGGNLANSTVMDNVILIAENDTDADGDGRLDSPDDEATRPAGWIKVDFDQAASEIGWDMLDVESVSANESSVDFFATDGSSVNKTFAQIKTIQSTAASGAIVYGNNTLNRVDLITASSLGLDDFDYVQFNIGGSMALDNIVYTPVPEPGTLMLLGLGCVGLVTVRRRRRQGE